VSDDIDVSFELTAQSASAWVDAHGLNPNRVTVSATELTGGVSSSVIAVRGEGIALLLKQALPRLRVEDAWEASPVRSRAEVAALGLLAQITPDDVPRVLADDPDDHVVALELLPASSRNWQSEIAEQRVHPELGTWAGRTLGRWHGHTADRHDLPPALDRFESFEELRLVPFHEAVMTRRPDLAGAIAPYLAELRTIRRCLVDGDYAPKNMLVDPAGRCVVLDLEVAHIGNPVFDLGFFLSFVVLSAVRWPGLTPGLRELAERFLSAYDDAVGFGFAGDVPSVTGHTACLVLARTDGVSPAAFLDGASRSRARAAAIELLTRPEPGIWSWL
jgi:phosphotransferase family enzyme